jgi:hypothetical protein
MEVPKGACDFKKEGVIKMKFNSAIEPGEE